MGLLGETTLTRRRANSATWAAGRATPGATTETTFAGSVQPMGGKDRQVLPEGLRQRDGRKVYAPRGTLRTDDQHAGTPADVVLVDGAPFTVVHVDSDHPLLEHDRALLVREQESE